MRSSLPDTFLPTPASAGAAPRPSWRRGMLLVLGVVLAHGLLLSQWRAPSMRMETPALQVFQTRTIESAAVPTPPAAPPAIEAPTSEPVRAAPKARPAPRRETPRPARATPTPPIAAPSLTRQDEPVEASSNTSPASVPSPSSEAATDAASTATAGDATGNAPAPGPESLPPVPDPNAGAPLRIPASVRLSFAASAQQGATPLAGVFGELVWLQDGERYDARLSLKFLFKTLRAQHSTGAIGASGIEPRRFSETRRTEEASHFVREEQRIVFSANVPPVPLLSGAQDRLSVLMQLGGQLAGDPGRYPPGSVIAVQTVGPRDAEIWTFNVEAEEPVSVPAGEFVARRLVRNPRKPFDDKLEVWLAPELRWLPVRLRQTQSNGDFADLQLRGAEPIERP